MRRGTRPFHRRCDEIRRDKRHRRRFVFEMLEHGKVKVEKKGLDRRITLMQGDALELPFCDNSFDVVGIAFGIRNIPDRERALREMLRVVVPGGAVMVLEMTFIQNRLFKLFYHVYLNHILPRLARRFSPNPAAYHYLADSIMNFPQPDAFAAMMEKAGMVRVTKYPLTLGVTYLHVGITPGEGIMTGDTPKAQAGCLRGYLHTFFIGRWPSRQRALVSSGRFAFPAAIVHLITNGQ